MNATTPAADHLLLVDDDREIRDLVSAYLQKNGLRVTTVPTASPANAIEP